MQRALAIWLGICWLAAEACTVNAVVGNDSEQQARQFIREHEEQIRPLDIALGLAWWNANTTGADAAFEAKVEAQNKLDAALADAQRFARLKQLHEAEISDPLLKRQIAVLYLIYLEKQVPPELLQRMTAKANAIEKAFNVYRAKVDGQELSDSDVRKTLSKSKDLAARQAVWEANKGVGAVVEQDLKQLVQLRNQAANHLGFPNYHALQLHITEHQPEVVVGIFDELDRLTREPFAKAKSEIDKALAADYGIAVADLRPWHYHDPFFQETPEISAVDLDSVFENVDIIDVCQRFYSGIELPIDDVIERSDLYEKTGKSPHAFCTDINREGDVRVLANIVPNQYWMTTMLHELGHAVYSSKNIPASVPYVLRTESHILTTEGVAMMFERFSSSADWLQSMGVKVPDPQAYDEAARIARRNKLLIFSRWCQVMLRFEQGMYENPEQDLNKLWWDLVEKYQLVHRPDDRDAPDYASKIHIVSAPCYYHNYMLGELFACQLHRAIASEVLQAKDPVTAVYHDNPRVGQFMREKVFARGRTLSWNQLTKHATGEELNARAFAEEFKQ